MMVLEVRIVVTLGEEIKWVTIGRERRRSFLDIGYVLFLDLMVTIMVCSCCDNSSSSMLMMYFPVCYILIKFT